MNNLDGGSRLYGWIWTTGRGVVIRYYRAQMPGGEVIPICAVARRGGPLEARAVPLARCFSSPYGPLRVSLADRVRDGSCLHAPSGVESRQSSRSSKRRNLPASTFGCQLSCSARGDGFSLRSLRRGAACALLRANPLILQ